MDRSIYVPPRISTMAFFPSSGSAGISNSFISSSSCGILSLVQLQARAFTVFSSMKAVCTVCNAYRLRRHKGVYTHRPLQWRCSRRPRNSNRRQICSAMTIMSSIEKRFSDSRCGMGGGSGGGVMTPHAAMSLRHGASATGRQYRLL